MTHKMKIAIITFNGTNNYGTALQELALNRAVAKIGGGKPTTISYRSTCFERKFSLLALRKYGLKRYIISLVGWGIDRIRVRKFIEFRENFPHTKWLTREEIIQNSDGYDLFIAGSDQIWNFEATQFDKTYFLDFILDKKKKTSYSASIGLNDISDDKALEISKLLKDFRLVSVREKTAQFFLNEKCGISAQTVLDPTLLLNCDDWMPFAKKVKIKNRYVFVYQVGFSKSLLDFSKWLAETSNCKLVFVPLPMGRIMSGKWKFYIGPSQWLYLIKNAEYVVTDSYHATLFSINFNKNFYVQVCEAENCMGTITGSRIHDILEMFSLTDRFIKDDYRNDKPDNIDFSYANSVLESERLRSYDFLRKVVNIDESI